MSVSTTYAHIRRYAGKIALWNTAKYVAIVVPTQTMLALVLAATLNAGLKGEKFSASFTFADVNIIGCFDAYFYVDVQPKRSCQPRACVFRLADVQLAWRSVCRFKRHYDYEHLVNGTVFMVIYLAALQDIPDSLYEAAELDGANAWHKFWYVTVPYLRPVTSFVVIMGLIGTFQLFDQSYIFSGGSGGPNNATLTVVLLIYQYAFKSLGTMGYAAALAFALAIVILLATWLQRKFSKEESLY